MKTENNFAISYKNQTEGCLGTENADWMASPSESFCEDDTPLSKYFNQSKEFLNDEITAWAAHYDS